MYFECGMDGGGPHTADHHNNGDNDISDARELRELNDGHPGKYRLIDHAKHTNSEIFFAQPTRIAPLPNDRINGWGEISTI